MAEKPATVAELSELHRLIAMSLNKRIEADIADNIPTDAATLGAAIKFLKDNAITADPASADDLQELRKKLSEQAQARRNKVGNVIALAERDIREA